MCVDLIQSQPKVFSAGLDIMEMYRKSPERCGEFWRAVQEIWLKLYSSNMVTIAAINVRINHKQQKKKADTSPFCTEITTTFPFLITLKKGKQD